MAKRTQNTKPKSRRRPRSARRDGAWLRSVSSFFGRLPVGLMLLAIGIGLGFGIGIALTQMAPTLMRHLELGDGETVVAEKPAKKTPTKQTSIKKKAEQPAFVEKPAAPQQPSEDVEEANTVAQQSAAVPAIAEEGAHQSAEITTPPPDEPVSEATQQAALPTPAAREPDLPLWLQNSVASRDPGDRPMITIVLDDVGVAPQHAEMAIALPAPIVLSIMTYAKDAATLARAAHAKGHEIMVHMPMQPMNAAINPGPNALTVGMEAQEIRRRVDWGLDRLAGYVGFNNHMGSRFTQDPVGMRVVLAEAKRRGLLFLDSKTIAGSVGDTLAAEMGVTHIARDVFLDDDMSEAAVARQLAQAEAIARKQGYAVAIGHPHSATIAVLKRWLPDAKARGFAIVPLTTIIKKREGVAG
nr:divergent polysaccharide deacetylase family protein [uncultured Dongia sp.]